MTFADFKNWREESLCAKPSLLDCGETNLYRALSTLQPKPLKQAGQIHRCDLAKKWLRRYGLPESDSRRAHVCRGVRHALRIILKEAASGNAILYAPKDVYPAYLEIAHSAGAEVRTYSTMPHPVLPTAKEDARSEFLLICNPWKPLGRFLTAEECGHLRRWITATNKRFILIDAVYDFGVPFHPTTMNLAETGRVIVLHSVTKGWLWPQTFGIAWAGGQSSHFNFGFRGDPPSQDQLALADQLLTGEANLPARVAATIDARKDKLLAVLPNAVAKLFVTAAARSSSGCYLFPVDLDASELLNQHAILGIPASVFGAQWSGTILTSLASVFAAGQKERHP